VVLLILNSVLLKQDKPMVSLDCQSALPCWRNVGSSCQSALTIFGTKALVDFGSAHVVTYGALFGFINIYFVAYLVCILYPEKNVFL